MFESGIHCIDESVTAATVTLFMRIAFLADIHGNLPALEAVIGDLKTHSPDAIYLLGDQINRCPWTNEVLDLIDQLGWPKVYGNHEYIISKIRTPENFEPFNDSLRFPTLWWTQAQLSAAHLAAMRQLPAEMVLAIEQFPSIYITHGIPSNCFRGFLAEDEDLFYEKSLASVTPEIVVTAHTHRPLDRQIGQRRVLNPGSVGLPYNGDPRAQYMLLDVRNGIWQPQFCQVVYNLEVLSAAFDSSGMRCEVGPEVELHLRTALTGLPWSSDFSYWLHFQPPPLQQDLAVAIPLYLQSHGPGNWAFR